MTLQKRIVEFSSHILFTLIVVGLGFLLYGAYLYFDSSQKISDIDQQREEIGAQVLELEPGISDPRPLVTSDIQLRRDRSDAVARQKVGIRLAGIGIALLAAAWLVWDFAKGRRRKQMSAEDTSPADAEPDQTSSV